MAIGCKGSRRISIMHLEWGWWVWTGGWHGETIEREHATRPPKRISSTRRQTPHTNNFNSKSAARTLLFRRPTYNKIDARAARGAVTAAEEAVYNTEPQRRNNIGFYRSSNNALDTILALVFAAAIIVLHRSVRKEFSKLFSLRRGATYVDECFKKVDSLCLRFALQDWILGRYRETLFAENCAGQNQWIKGGFDTEQKGPIIG